ncbi:hypothetical protein POPTR_008G121800v4 [Populus trichocarpa]|uniref:Uncharacterized protein n=1 Tax=Populus trichocarpa TaxID=3694 RepID=A0A3N7FE32_POPTR|nr:hypothetical protein BDE02_08G110200 [Populus trichocarpa]RQO94566.1 hypothetical protein POPTR_008G121800v4 [Populus trichocarpa]
MNKENGRANMKVMVVIDETQPPPKCNYVVSSAFGPACICPLSATMDLFNSVQQQNKKVALGILEKAKRICASKGGSSLSFVFSGNCGGNY